MGELNLQAKWYNAHRDHVAVQDIINHVADNYSKGEVSITVYQAVMIALCKVRDKMKDLEEQYELLKGIKKLHE